MPANRVKSKKSTQTTRRRPQGKAVPILSDCTELILVDSEPLRQKIWRQYQTAVKKFEKTSSELHQFKNTDIDRYRLWYEGEFSREIIALQKSQQAVADLAQWMDQIHTYASVCDTSITASLSILSEAKAEGRLDQLWQELADKQEEEEQKAKAHKTSKEKFWPEFEEEFEDIFEEATFEFYEEKINSGRHQSPRSHRVQDENTERSLRTIYHQLAMRLHPDTNPEPSDEQTDLFQSVQEAYREQDLESLEQIWKKLEGKAEGPFSWKTSAISEIISRKKSLDRRNRDINAELKYAKQHPAWNFSKLAQNKASLTTLRHKVREALKYEQLEINDEWMELNEILSQLEKSSKKKNKSRATKVKRKV